MESQLEVKKIKNIEITKSELYKNLLKECYKYAETSNHPTTHTAALLVKNNKVILAGKNVLPPGVKHLKERFEGEDRHMYPNHAERDLVYKAAKEGVKTAGLTMVMPWIPCIPCANAVISSGIEELIVHKQMIERTRKEWQAELMKAIQIMQEANVKIIAYDGEVGAKAYMHGNKWVA